MGTVVSDCPRSGDALQQDSLLLEVALYCLHMSLLFLAPHVRVGDQVSVMRLLVPQFVGKSINGSRPKFWHDNVLQTIVMAFDASATYFWCTR